MRAVAQALSAVFTQRVQERVSAVEWRSLPRMSRVLFSDLSTCDRSAALRIRWPGGALTPERRTLAILFLYRGETVGLAIWSVEGVVRARQAPTATRGA